MPRFKKKKARDYPVGFEKPPKGTQFKPGESGNPAGRPKKEKSFKGLFNGIMEEDVEIVDKRTGKNKKMTMRELILRKTATMAAQGDMPSIRQISKWDKELGHLDKPEEPIKSKVLMVNAPMSMEEWEERYAKPRPDSAFKDTDGNDSDN